jgi:nucleotide-binding universal stress UspA family protein
MPDAATASRHPVVVGVDGSKHAVRAALWASAEAVDRDAPLQLVYVIDTAADNLDAALDDARLALDEAWTAVEETLVPVELGSEILRGDAAVALIEASRGAQLVCVGARGRHDGASGHRGANAAIIAESAFCPVAIIRRRHGRRQRPGDRWIVAILDESPVSHGVLQTAVNEARCRDAPVLALTSWPSRLSQWRGTDGDRELRQKLDRYLQDSEDDDADVRICALPIPSDVSDLLAKTADVDQLVIVGQDNPDLIAALVGSEARTLLRKTNCSVMVYRELQMPDQPATVVTANAAMHDNTTAEVAQ